LAKSIVQTYCNNTEQSCQKSCQIVSAITTIAEQYAPNLNTEFDRNDRSASVVTCLAYTRKLLRLQPFFSGGFFG